MFDVFKFKTRITAVANKFIFWPQARPKMASKNSKLQMLRMSKLSKVVK